MTYDQGEAMTIAVARIVGRSVPDLQPRPRASLWFEVAARQAHFFDAETGMRL